MKLIAHRGASLERPENSLESLEYARSSARLPSNVMFV